MKGRNLAAGCQVSCRETNWKALRMDIFFQDPAEIPLPPDEVRIRQFKAEPWPDNRRVRISLEITPFQKRPNGEVRITDPAGEEAASLTIVETIAHRMEFTVHLRGRISPGQYTAQATVYYADPEEEAGGEGRAAASPRPEEGSEPEKLPLPLPTRIKVVDSAETAFTIQGGEESRP
jgi:hypothetical protein